MGVNCKQERLKKLQRWLSELEVSAALLILSRDVFYYTGSA